MTPETPVVPKWKHFWRNLAVCFLSATALGAGCVDLAPNIYRSSSLGWGALLLIGAAVVAPPLLVRNFNARRIGRPELLVVLAALAGQVVGMVGFMSIDEAIWRRRCADGRRSVACIQFGPPRSVKRIPDAGPDVISTVPR